MGKMFVGSAFLSARGAWVTLYINKLVNYVDEDVSDSGEFVSRDIENSDNE